MGRLAGSSMGWLAFAPTLFRLTHRRLSQTHPPVYTKALPLIAPQKSAISAQSSFPLLFSLLFSQRCSDLQPWTELPFQPIMPLLEQPRPPCPSKTLLPDFSTLSTLDAVVAPKPVSSACCRSCACVYVHMHARACVCVHM